MDIRTRDGKWMVMSEELDEVEVNHPDVTVVGDCEPGEEVLHLMEQVEPARFVVRMVIGADTLLSIIREFARKGDTNVAAS